MATAGRSAAGMIVANDGPGLDEARTAARLAGLSALPETGWAEAEAELTGGFPALLLVEAGDVADATLHRALPVIAAAAGQAACAVVVALEPPQIDLVAAHLLGPHAQLLCAPTLADRAAALVLARAMGGGRLRDPAGGDDAERLAALAREVARIGEVLADLATRAEERPAVADRSGGYAPPPPDVGAPAVTAGELRALIRSRRLRDAEFGRGLFEDPAWDMLLDLFAAELEGGQVSVSSLCIAAAVAPTTALRWIGRMTAAGLLERRGDARDRRRAFMHLTDRARTGLLRYFVAARQAGGPIA